MYSEELKKEIHDCYGHYLFLQRQSNEDYEKVKKIIEQSDKMLLEYENNYKKIIKEKDEEIKKLEKRVKKLEENWRFKRK